MPLNFKLGCKAAYCIPQLAILRPAIAENDFCDDGFDRKDFVLVKVKNDFFLACFSLCFPFLIDCQFRSRNELKIG